MARLDYHLVKRSMSGPMEECGDTGVILEGERTCFVALVDGVGHGKEAHRVADVAEQYLREESGRELVEMMQGLHAALKGTRGVVAAVCRLDTGTGEIRFVGIGNITVRIFGERNHRFVSRDGIVGYMIASPREQRERLQPGDLVMLSSDGIKEHFNPDEFPGLLSGPAQKIAETVLQTFGKRDDDASCIVLRYQ